MLHMPGIQAVRVQHNLPHVARFANYLLHGRFHQPFSRNSCHNLCPALSSSAAETAATAPPPPAAGGKSRAYPDEPRVGVGVVVFRRPLQQSDESPEILLIRRAKEPAKGQWCFPGGSLELGESIAACAAREVLEETGLHVRNDQSAVVEGFSNQLHQPVPFAAVDSIVHDDAGLLKFHYVVVEAAAMAADGDAVPVASDDVDGVQWVQVAKLRQLDNLTKNCARIAEEAANRFDLSR